MQYLYGDKVVFTDDRGEEQVGTVINIDVDRTSGEWLGIDNGGHETYVRKPEEVRLAQDYEVHRADIKRLNRNTEKEA